MVGCLHQGDGAGVIGGQGGQGRALPLLMVRIRDCERTADLATVANRRRPHSPLWAGTADLTVRQNIQLHWVTIESLPEVIQALWSVGLNTVGACGDVTRNITGCPLAGVDADEIVDASPLALQATNALVGNPEFYNLPRKFKISISGCRVWCAYPEINDIGLTAVTRTFQGQEGSGILVASWRRALRRTFCAALTAGCIHSLESGAAYDPSYCRTVS